MCQLGSKYKIFRVPKSLNTLIELILYQWLHLCQKNDILWLGIIYNNATYLVIYIYIWGLTFFTTTLPTQLYISEGWHSLQQHYLPSYIYLRVGIIYNNATYPVIYIWGLAFFTTTLPTQLYISEGWHFTLTCWNTWMTIISLRGGFVQ
jgi:hypothetical protein